MRIRLPHFVAICLLSWIAASFTWADTQPAPGPLPGHSSHGETFDEGPRHAAYLMGTTGNVNFPITTTSPDAQKFFNQGIGQLHGFWFLESERSFRQAAALDPECAMAYWGMAMANFNNGGRAKGFAAEAVKHKGQANISPREVAWIDMIEALYKDEPKDWEQRQKNFLESIKKLSEENPDDIEIKALRARYIWEFKSKTNPLNDYEAVDKLIAEVLAVNPQHPAHHFRIHLWDGKDANRAITAAANCGQTSPGIAHMWHMPGHTYSSLARYEDTVFAQEASARVDHAYMIRDRVMPYEIHNYAHNNEWLIRDLVYVGRVGDAVDLAKNMIELPRHPRYNMVTNRGSGAEFGRSRLIDTLSMHERWDQYIALSDTVYLNEDPSPEQQIERLRYLGVACAATGKADRALQQIATLESLAAKCKVEMFANGAKAEADAKGRNAKPEEVKKARDDARNPLNDRINSIRKAIAHIEGEQAIAANDFTSAVDLFVEANVRKEHLSQVYLKAGLKAKAEEVAKQSVNERKNQVFPLANEIEILYGCDKKDAAKAVFENLRTFSSHIDLTVPQYARLQKIAIEFGYGADWRKPREMPADIGTRPELDTLGPFRWHPADAPDFTATAADGSRVSLSSYRGKPVVVLFYLGYGCLHCTKQLHDFAPMTKQFADAGISLLAVSTDTPADLNRAWESAKLDGGFPFPLLSDAGLEVFKNYHCYDDFEKVPLHGTMLIDGKGKIRWQDIGPEPFGDTGFLLGESKRLLSQP